MTGEFNQMMYGAGYRDAETDTVNEGIEYAQRHADNQCAYNVNGDYVIGYRTAVAVLKERVFND